MNKTVRTLLVIFVLSWSFQSLNAQNYTSFFTGNTTNIVTNPQGGACLMGGASENDEAMKWFLQRASGGDILVLRASGSNGYNNYLYSQLGITVNSVETIVFNNANASNDPYVHQKIAQAEAIWFAGGDQWNYISYWRNTTIDSLINDGIINRNIVIGGTSAGMAILGRYYFSAQNGSINSAQALSNPFHPNHTPDTTAFLKVPYLEHVITDTHYDNPDRRGRHVSFMAKLFIQYGINEVKGIACDEYTAVCIDENGIARVFGEYPQYDEDAYFVSINCELTDPNPEEFSSGNPLTWFKDSAAITVCRLKGTITGSNYLHLNDWTNNNGAIWEKWWVNQGAFFAGNTSAPNCQPLGISENKIV
jgi:cyanophycinase-like exopeptidase